MKPTHTARRRGVEIGRGATGRRRAAAGFRVVILDRQRQRRVSKKGVSTILKRAAELLNVHDQEMTLVFGSDRLLRDLNHRFRNTKSPTDVLAFAANGDAELGDVIISVETAARQARERAHSLQHELSILAMHGLLHLLGHDHEADDGSMKRLESRMRRSLLSRKPSAERGRAKNRARSIR